MPPLPSPPTWTCVGGALFVDTHGGRARPGSRPRLDPGRHWLAGSWGVSGGDQSAGQVTPSGLHLPSGLWAACPLGHPAASGPKVPSDARSHLPPVLGAGGHPAALPETSICLCTWMTCRSSYRGHRDPPGLCPLHPRQPRAPLRWLPAGAVPHAVRRELVLAPVSTPSPGSLPLAPRLHPVRPSSGGPRPARVRSGAPRSLKRRPSGPVSGRSRDAHWDSLYGSTRHRSAWTGCRRDEAVRFPNKQEAAAA